MVRERNREIEAIINKLGDETHDTQKQLLQQYERKVKDVEQKWKAEIEECKAATQQWKDKFKSEEDSRGMLDENLRVLGRRINDLELDIQGKKDKISRLEGQNAQLLADLGDINKKHQRELVSNEDDMKFKFDQ